MKTSFRDICLDWFKIHELDLSQCGFSVRVRRSPDNVDNPSITAEIDTPYLTSQVTIWESGECIKEAIELETDAFLINEALQLDRPTQASIVLAQFCTQLGCSIVE